MESVPDHTQTEPKGEQRTQSRVEGPIQQVSASRSHTEAADAQGHGSFLILTAATNAKEIRWLWCSFETKLTCPFSQGD